MTQIGVLRELLVEQRDTQSNLNFRRDAALLNILGSMIERIDKLEERPATSFDANVLTAEQLQVLGDNMYHRGGLREAIAAAVETALENEIESHISDYLDKVEIEVECSASIRDRN